jgi:hypothetical protein
VQEVRIHSTRTACSSCAWHKLHSGGTRPWSRAIHTLTPKTPRGPSAKLQLNSHGLDTGITPQLFDWVVSAHTLNPELHLLGVVLHFQVHHARRVVDNSH